MPKNSKRSSAGNTNPANPPAASPAPAAPVAAVAAPKPPARVQSSVGQARPASPTEQEVVGDLMNQLLSLPGAETQNNGSDANAAPNARANGQSQNPTQPAAQAPPARKRRGPDAYLGAMDEMDDDNDQAQGDLGEATAADMAGTEAEATANDTGEGLATAEEPNESLDEQTDFAAEGSGEEGHEQDDDGEGQNALPRGVRQKLTRQSAKIDRQEQELETLRSQVAELQAKREETPVPNAAPVTDAEVKLSNEINSLRERRGRIGEALRVAREQNSERVTVRYDGMDPIEVSYAEAEQALETVSDRMGDRKDDLRSLRRERESVRTQINQALAEMHPWTQDVKHPARAKLEEHLRKYPALREIPEARLWIASAMAYYSTLQRRAAASAPAGQQAGRPAGQNGNGNGNGNGVRPAPRPVARATRPGAAPMAVNGSRAQLGAAAQKFAQHGDETSGKELLGKLLTS